MRTISRDLEWDVAEASTDVALGLELEEIEAKLRNLEKAKEKILRGEEESRISPSKSGHGNVLRTQIKITGDSSTVEFLGPANPKDKLCPPRDSSGVEDSASSGVEDSASSGVEDSASSGATPEGTPQETPQETPEGFQSTPEVETKHPNTIRSYVAAMLAFFGNLRVEFQSGETVYTRKLPVFYGNREKLLHIEDHEFRELMNGNTNYLPRASLVLESMAYDATRQGNKNTAVSREISMASLSGQSAYAMVQGAPSPYNISVKLNIITRGMNDAMMLVEQVAAFFTPHHTFNMVDEISGMDSQVRLQLDSVMFEVPEIDQFSNNEVMLDFSFTLFGNMFKPRTREQLAEIITVNIGQI